MQDLLNNIPNLSSGTIGIERETLRTNTDAYLSQTLHPESLGNVYTHKNITIDYAESLLELVTDTHNNPENLYLQLLNLHKFTAQNINNELLWPTSMPCILPDNPELIEFGYFGQSNGGKIKRLYRSGLAYRYGRPMQMIAGIHFNYSPSQDFWNYLSQYKKQKLNQNFKNEIYMAALRNIGRTSWLVCYLFGASPACDFSFQPAQQLLTRHHKRSLIWNNACTLRMSQLGYQNKADFSVDFNNLEAYIKDLIYAVLTPSPIYEYIGIQAPDGNYRQISTNILQIENEYYASARPKQIPNKNEAPTLALARRGILYLELRLPDCNPYSPVGISLEQIYFLETYMLYCLMKNSPEIKHCEQDEINRNRLRAACCGLSKDLKLSYHCKEKSMKSWALEILEEMLKIAAIMDKNTDKELYQNSVREQIKAVESGEVLAAKVRNDLIDKDFINFAQELQNKHLTVLKSPLDSETKQELNNLRNKSLEDFAKIEKAAENQIPFSEYLEHYFDELKAFARES